MLLSVLEAGYVKRYSITDDGGQSVQSVYGPADIFPLTPVFKAIFHQEIYHGREPFYYEPITPVVMHTIDRVALENAVAQDATIYRDLLYVSGTRLGSNIQRLENMSLRVANRKVAHQLVYFADTFGEKTKEGTRILAPLTHQSLADILNLARETVTHCMIRLEAKGLIKVDKHIIVTDIEKLRQAAH